LLNAEHSSTTSPQGTVNEELIVFESFVSVHLEAWWWIGPQRTVINNAGMSAAVADRVGMRSCTRCVQPRRAITRASVRLVSVRSRLSALTVGTLQPLTGLTALTGPSGGPERGSYVMARRRPVSEIPIAALNRTNWMRSSRSYGFSWNGMTARAK
jgi:hypothetical protein